MFSGPVGPVGSIGPKTSIRGVVARKILMANDSIGTIACTIASLGSIAWIPAAFGHDLMSVVGQTGGVMAATLLGLVGVFSIANEFDLLD